MTTHKSEDYKVSAVNYYLNEDTTQYGRGGGTACFLDDTLHAILQKATTDIDTCDLHSSTYV